MSRHHCKGTLRLRERTSTAFKAYAFNIHCRG
jgi:hypothetical protein